MSKAGSLVRRILQAGVAFALAEKYQHRKELGVVVVFRGWNMACGDGNEAVETTS
jgi:hypothetical protein